LVELRAKQEAEMIAHSVPTTPQAKGFDDDLKQEMQSKMTRLEAENDLLRREMEKLRNGGSDLLEATAAAMPEQAVTPVAVPVPIEDVEALHTKIKQLEDEVAQREAENKKIVGDKDKLEAYTKRTLAKFQDKYLVALQECKAKLKEKQDKIEALEQRSTIERTVQKREERLLSTSVYELGMAIMQARLKDNKM
jgi:protein HOOK3